MLVLSRKIGERIVIGDSIVLTILAVRSGQVRVGIDAPPSLHIRREELLAKDFEKPREVRKPAPAVTSRH